MVRLSKTPRDYSVTPILSTIMAHRSNTNASLTTVIYHVLK